MGLVLSILLTVPFAAMFLVVRLNDKWRITHNEFEHHSWGRADDSLARGAKRVRSTYPDLLELLLAGAGTLIVYSANGNTELRRIHHVPMLPFVRRRIDDLLETIAVTPTADIAAEEEAAAEAAAHEHDEHHGEDDKEPL
jgi:fatty acid desaturase